MLTLWKHNFFYYIKFKVKVLPKIKTFKIITIDRKIKFIDQDIFGNVKCLAGKTHMGEQRSCHGSIR